MGVFGAVQGGGEAARGVVDVGRVDEGSPAVEQGQPASARPVEDAPDELRIAGPPDEVRADDDDPQGRRVALEGQQFGLRLRARVLAAGVLGRGGFGADALERAAGVRYRG